MNKKYFSLRKKIIKISTPFLETFLKSEMNENKNTISINKF